MKQTIGNKLILGFGVIIFVVVVQGVITYSRISTLRVLQDEGAALSVTSGVAREAANLGSRLYQIAADAEINRELDKSKTDWNQAYRDALEGPVQTLEKNADTSAEKVAVVELKKSIESMSDLFMQKMFPLLKNTKDMTDEIRKIDAEMDVVVSSIQKSGKILSDSMLNEAKEADEKFDQVSGQVVLVSVGVVVFLLLLSMAVAYQLIHAITQPLREVLKITDEISKGDTRSRVSEVVIARQDEFGELGRKYQLMINAIQGKERIAKVIADGDLTSSVVPASEFDIFGQSLLSMNQNLHKTMANIKDAVIQVNSGAEQVSSASQSLSRGATEQASSMEEISSSIVEIGSQTKQNAANSNLASTLAAASKLAAEKGKSQIGTTVQAMTEIDESSKQIGKIIKVIDDIAFQTNLLALNAAVEAARAGKHGKGFAVVADEVRSLAGRSAKAAKETAELIDTSSKRVENGLKVASETAQSFVEIVDGAIKVADLVGEIAIASQQQAQGIAQISTGLQQIDQVTQQNTSSAEETASASEELSGQAAEVQRLVSQFKL